MALIMTAVTPLLDDATRESRQFFEVLIRAAPTVSSAQALARLLGINPSTFVSRFVRAGLPSPKRYLVATRLLYSAAFLEDPRVAAADVAYRLRHSSPQSFCRHVRATVGVAVGEFRRRHTFPALLDDYTAHLILPFQSAFRSFCPLSDVLVS